MRDFTKFDCDFNIRNSIKETPEKSIYKGVMIRSIESCKIKIEEEIVIIKLLKVCESEIFFLTTLKHQGIPKLLALWEEGDYIIIVQEKISGLSLFDYIKENSNIPDNNRIIIAYNLAKIISYLHKGCGYDIIHGDISPNNIIISDYGEVYLIDFGSSFYNSIVKKEKFYYGTQGYFSPKILDDPMSVNKGIDLYSFAMIIKLLGIDKISIEGYDLYKKCLKKSILTDFDIDKVMDELLDILN